MRKEDIDWENPYEVWEYLMQPTIDREPGETDEHYREKILKYMKDKLIKQLLDETVNLQKEVEELKKLIESEVK